MSVICDHCVEHFEVSPSMRGGLANCPYCNRATAVRGGPEPLFLFGVLFGVLLGVGSTCLIWISFGATAGLITGACAAAGLTIAIASS